MNDVFEKAQELQITRLAEMIEELRQRFNLPTHGQTLEKLITDAHNAKTAEQIGFIAAELKAKKQ